MLLCLMQEASCFCKLLIYSLFCMWSGTFEIFFNTKKFKWFSITNSNLKFKLEIEGHEDHTTAPNKKCAKRCY